MAVLGALFCLGRQPHRASRVLHESLDVGMVRLGVIDLEAVWTALLGFAASSFTVGVADHDRVAVPPHPVAALLVLQHQQRSYWVRRDGNAVVIRNADGEG